MFVVFVGLDLWLMWYDVSEVVFKCNRLWIELFC